MTIYIDDDKIKEANERCNFALMKLSEIAQKYSADKDPNEYTRIMGKIEGVKLAQNYFNQCLGDMTND